MGVHCLLVRNRQFHCDHVGSSSACARIVVYSPQIYENYTLQSGEGLSVPFVVIWLLGDLFNLVGAALAGLLPTVIILALYVSKLSKLSQPIQ